MSNQKIKSSDIKMSVLLKFLKDYYAEKGYPPNVREMGKAMGVKSTSTVVYYLKKLEQKGLIIREMAKTRAITYVKVDPDQVKKEETLKRLKKGSCGFMVRPSAERPPLRMPSLIR